jgi:hypothetical protein
MKTWVKSAISGSATVSVATLSLLAGSSIPAFAATLTLNSVTGAWTDAIGGAGTVTGIGTNELRWGTPVPSTGQKSGFRFDGAAPPSLTIETDTPFLLGTFTHFNFPLATNTAILSADLGVTLDIENTLQTLNYTFSLEETPNQGGTDGFTNDFLQALLGAFPEIDLPSVDLGIGGITIPGFNFNLGSLFPPSSGVTCPSFQVSSTPCDDRVTLVSGLTPQTFSINNVLYNLETFGFAVNADGSNPSASLITEEGAATNGFLFARITAQDVSPEEPPVSVPEPGALIGFSMLGIYLANRRSKSQKA